ncbi:MAG: hypothetical protein IJ713_03850 [Oscillibacter sp.]|nr:hypothetical protein [Oscillibacter sp.]
MPDWKEMYLHLMRETERAVRILTEAQQHCEELYLDAPVPRLIVLSPEAAAPCDAPGDATPDVDAPPAGDAPLAGNVPLTDDAAPEAVPDALPPEDA